eukprot:scaffold35853_cov140-Isochrysis_galbana.AAC.1
MRCPFVGHKRSGYGSHSGVDGWRQFSRPKSLVYSAAPPAAALPGQAAGLSAPAVLTRPAGLVAAIVLGAAVGATVALVIARR